MFGGSGGVEKKKKAGTNRFVSQAGSLCREVELLLAVFSVVFFQLISTAHLKAEAAQNSHRDIFKINRHKCKESGVRDPGPSSLMGEGSRKGYTYATSQAPSLALAIPRAPVSPIR